MGQEKPQIVAENVYRAFPILRFPYALEAGLQPNMLLLAAVFLVVLTPLIGAMVSSGAAFLEFYQLDTPEESDLFASIPGDSRELLPAGGLPKSFWWSVSCGVSQIRRLNGEALFYGFAAMLIFSVFQVTSARIFGARFCRGQSYSALTAMRETCLKWSSIAAGFLLTVVLMGATVLAARCLLALFGPLRVVELVSSSLEFTFSGIALLMLSLFLVAYLL